MRDRCPRPRRGGHAHHRGTDSPAFPPWFEEDDPSNGQGFEGAVAYAVADELGFSPEDVIWTVVPFNNAFAPGAKDFDFDINQVSISPEREEARLQRRLLAVARSSRSPVLFPVRVLATVYVDLFRGVPVLLVLFLLAFGVPALRLEGVPNDPVFWGTVALVLSPMVCGSRSANAPCWRGCRWSSPNTRSSA